MDTGWEEVLWWGFGVGVRNGTWSSMEEVRIVLTVAFF
jgi:hypothetical protein